MLPGPPGKERELEFSRKGCCLGTAFIRIVTGEKDCGFAEVTDLMTEKWKECDF